MALRRFAFAQQGAAVLRPYLLLSDLDGLAVAKIWRTFDDDGIARSDSGDYFSVGAASTAQSDGASLGFVIFDEEDDFLAVFFMYRALWNDDGGARGRGFFHGLVAEKGDLDAHVGKDARVELEEGDAHLDGGFLAIGGRDDGAHAAGDLPIGIGIEDGSD